MAQQASQEQAKNHFFDPTNGFSNDDFSVRKFQLEEKMRDSQIARQLISAIVETSSRAELAMFYHQILCSPPKTTLLKAIKNKQLETFPGLTYELINHHLPESTATHKGHMVRRRQGHQSTRNQQKAIIDSRAQVDDMHPPEQICNVEDEEFFVMQS